MLNDGERRLSSGKTTVPFIVISSEWQIYLKKGESWHILMLVMHTYTKRTYGRIRVPSSYLLIPVRPGVVVTESRNNPRAQRWR